MTTPRSFQDLYTSGEYLEKHSSWHIKDSPWKAEQILRMIRQNDLALQTICEVGCGAGKILRQLQLNMSAACEFWGYEISPQAFELCEKNANPKLHFTLNDFLQVDDVSFDLILLIDLIEHLEDYFDFLRKIRVKSQYKILHIPLDLSVQTVLRSTPILQCRKEYGHIHYFTKELALQSLVDSGYEVLSYFYVPWFTFPTKSTRRNIAKLPRRLAFAIHQDWAIRILGGASLMVLAE